MKKRLSLIALEVSLILLAVISLIPTYYLFVTTFKTPQEAATSPMGLPAKIYFENYLMALQKMDYLNVLKNNFIITAVAVVGVVITASMTGYAIARRYRGLNKFSFYFLLAGLMVPFQVSIIPLFKLMGFLKLMDSIWGVGILNIFIITPFAVFLFKNFVQTIPMEIEECAFLDGCTPFTVYRLITLPLLKPVVATIVILNSLQVWNEFMTPLLFLTSRKNSVILLEIFRNVGQFQTDWTTSFPMMVLGMAPLLLFYLFMQRYIIEGITNGSVKG